VSTLLLDRLRDLFLAPPADTAPATQVAERVLPVSFGVLAPTDDAGVAGAAVALAAARAHRSACAVLCVWTGEAETLPRRGLAGGSARRLCGRMAARGLTVAARGRLVEVALPASDTEARAACERALAAAGDAPVVLVVAGPRPPALDPLLAALDRIVVVPAPDAAAGLEDLAVSSAAHLGRSTAVLRVPASASPPARALASAGLLLSPALRAATATTLGGDRG
jgi:hypothetical protein